MEENLLSSLRGREKEGGGIHSPGWGGEDYEKRVGQFRRGDKKEGDRNHRGENSEGKEVIIPHR